MVLVVALLVGAGWLILSSRGTTPDAPAELARRPEPEALSPAVLPVPAREDTQALPAQAEVLEPTAEPVVAPDRRPEPRGAMGTQRLRIVVVDERAEPAANARVRVWDQDSPREDEPAVQELFTDGRGRTEVTMDRFESALVADRPDLGTSGLWKHTDVAAAANADGESPIVLRPMGTVRGIALDATGRPVLGARVRPASYGHFASGGRARLPEETVTDAHGRFELTVDARAFLTLWAEADGRTSASERLRVESGAVHEIVLHFPGDWQITGRLQDARGQAVAGGTVRLWLALPGDGLVSGELPQGDCHNDSTRSAEDGGFHFDVPRLATYTVLASVGPRAPASDAARVVVDAAHSQPSVVLTLPESAAIAGRLRSERGEPLAGVTIRATPSDERLLQLDCYAPSLEDRFGRASTETDAEGRFRLEPLHPSGVYRLVCRPDAQHPARLLVRRDVPAGTLDLDWIASEAELVRSFVTGFVFDAETGAPIAHYGVELIHRVDGQGFTLGERVAERGDDGSFRVEGLSPGETYALRVTADGWGAAQVPMWTAPEGEHHVLVRLERPGTLEVEVRDEAGQLASLAEVFVALQGHIALAGFKTLLPQHTDDTGRALFGNLDTGTWHVTASRGELRAEADVVVGGGGIVRLRLDLRAP